MLVVFTGKRLSPFAAAPALAWRRSFFRGEAVEALAQAIRGLNIPYLTILPEG